MSHTTIAPACDEQAQSAPTDSLARYRVSFWLLEHDEAHRNAMRLHTMSLRRMDGPDRDALWSGYWSLKKEADTVVERLRDRGGLLFLGQPHAIKAARRLEEGCAA